MKNAAITRGEYHLSGFDLTTSLIRGELGKMGLNANAKMVLLYFTTCYNEKKGVVFPKIKTIADSMGISEIGVKRAVAELVEKGFVLKTKKGLNANQYIITNKVMKYHDDTTLRYHGDTSDNHNDTSKGITVILPCHEVKEHELKQTTNKQNEVDLKKIPEIIFKNAEIHNKQAYWRSLSEDAKKEYIEKQKKIDKQKQLEQQRKEEQKKYFAELEEIRKEPPFYEALTKKEASSYVDKLIKIDRSLINGVIGQYLIKKFGFEV